MYNIPTVYSLYKYSMYQKIHEYSIHSVNMSFM